MAARHDHHYRRGNILFYEGNPALGVFLLCKGKVKLVYRNAAGKGQVVAIIRAPNMVGDRAFLAEEPYRAECVVLEDSCLCFIDGRVFREVLSTTKEACLSLAVRYSRLLGEAWSLAADLSLGTVRQRMAAFILRKLEHDGADPKGWIPLPETRREVAEIVGTASEAVCRFFARFHAEGLIAFDQDRFRVLDVSAVREIAESPGRNGHRPARRPGRAASAQNPRLAS
ncbi:MAG: Crp/Fnr family transcriptional regulator [Elusimicrobia bacterium]|nr:Crp/Fnr family transcriptional regulator [Elusimicrobiota bacterium]